MSGLWALDIETEGWSTFVLGRAISQDGQVARLDKHRDMWTWYQTLDKSDLVIAHNGGCFDFLSLIDSAPEQDWRGTLAGSGLVSLSVKGGAECRDSKRLFPLSLKDWSGEKDETGLGCECGKLCGGYCAIKADMEPAKRKRLAEYCEQDCVALLHAWQRSIERGVSDGFDLIDERGSPRRTVGSAAYATAARLCGLDPKPLDWTRYELEREAYAGGRNEVQCVAADDGHRHDLRAAYAAALTLPVPTGEPTIVWGDAATRAYIAGKPGAYWARVFSPPDIGYALLWHRSPKGRLLWATGELEGTWTHVELQAAEKYGLRILQINRGLVYPKEEAIYKPYFDHVWEKRDLALLRHEDSCSSWTFEKSWAGVVKFLGNAPSGKLAQSPGVSRLYVGEVPHPDDRKGDWSQLSSHAWVQVTRPSPPKCARPIHAAVMTSRVHAALLDALALGGLYYCDTDSSYARDKMPDVMLGSGLGEWKYEGAMTRWRARGPKLYSYVDADGKTEVRMKGFPRADERVYDAAISGQEIAIDHGVFGVRTALAKLGKAFGRREMTRRLRGDPRVVGTRWLRDDGWTTPLHRGLDGRYEWPVNGAPDAEETLKLRKKPRDFWKMIAG